MGSRQTGDRNLFEAIKGRKQSIFGSEMVTTQSLDHVFPLTEIKNKLYLSIPPGGSKVGTK